MGLAQRRRPQRDDRDEAIIAEIGRPWVSQRAIVSSISTVERDRNGSTYTIPSRVKDSIQSIEEGGSHDGSPKKLKKQTKTRKCINYLNEFTANTSLHGLKYLGEEKRSTYERLWWVIMFSLSLITCTYLILKVWNKWQTIPVIVSFAEKSTPIWQMSFPAVTLCSETKFIASDFNYSGYYHTNYRNNMTSSQQKRFDAISLLCMEKDNYGNLTSDHSTIDIITQLAPELRSVIFQCKWKSVITDCSDLFSPTLTDEGLCYSFNMLDMNDIYRQEIVSFQENSTDEGRKSSGWTLNKGYEKNVSIDTYPKRATGSGATAGLFILLISLRDELDYLCRGPTQGYKISFHTPGEIPRVSQEYIRIPIGQEVIIGVKPNVLSTSDGLINYDPKKRHCYFPNERHLKYFKVYTKKNCDLECISNYTTHVCGCVPFFMPHDPGTKICSTGSLSCVQNAEEELLIIDIKSEMASNGIFKEESDIERNTRKRREEVAAYCDCLPGCTSIDYDTEISQANFDWSETFKAMTQHVNSSQITAGIKISTVTVFFKQSEYIKSIRSELYGQTDFLANCGGLLGLCLGFSILSLIEIIYFLTLRLFCKIRNSVSCQA